MRLFTRRQTGALVATGALLCGLSATAQAQIAFAPCAESNEFACAHLTVALDPHGQMPGTVKLALRRHRAAVGEAHTAIIALAGGPGQPALPFSGQFAELLGPIAATRDLIVFDQRGIGQSQALACPKLQALNAHGPFGRALEACAARLGPRRSFYTTADTVADIEAIRQAGGYEKLLLYGTSYGTKVAEAYAQTYPSHVEALVLDSVVTPNGPDPLERSTFEAVPRILRQLCSQRACAHITGNPVADLTRVLARLRKAPLRARVIGPRGRTHTLTVRAPELIEVLLAGDFSRPLRADFLTAIAASARGDAAPLARILATGPGAEGEQGSFDVPLYFATTCEEQDFPWSRAAAPVARIAQAIAAARALPASAYAPFSANDAIAISDVEACAHWPFTSAAPALDTTPFPTVPTLILSGADDLRTPTAGARELAAQIPGAHLLLVPYTGHSVLGDEPTACAREAMIAMLSSHPIKSCRTGAPPPSLLPPPLPPLSIGSVSSEPGYHGLTGRTLHAVRLTLTDLIRQLALEAGSGEGLSAGAALRTGGLRTGWAELSSAALSLHGYSYVPGMTISGAIRLETASLQIAGADAAHGSLHIGARRALLGTLDGQRVLLPASPRATAAIVGRDAQESSNGRFGGSGAGALERELAGLLASSGP